MSPRRPKKSQRPEEPPVTPTPQPTPVGSLEGNLSSSSSSGSSPTATAAALAALAADPSPQLAMSSNEPQVQAARETAAAELKPATSEKKKASSVALEEAAETAMASATQGDAAKRPPAEADDTPRTFSSGKEQSDSKTPPSSLSSPQMSRSFSREASQPQSPKAAELKPKVLLPIQSRDPHERRMSSADEVDTDARIRLHTPQGPVPIGIWDLTRFKYWHYDHYQELRREWLLQRVCSALLHPISRFLFLFLTLPCTAFVDDPLCCVSFPPGPCPLLCEPACAKPLRMRLAPSRGAYTYWTWPYKLCAAKGRGGTLPKSLTPETRQFAIPHSGVDYFYHKAPFLAHTGPLSLTSMTPQCILPTGDRLTADTDIRRLVKDKLRENATADANLTKLCVLSCL
ncbi:hypothetical protein cyc_07412 [Cyclospora cayetanensis]|uniref:Uncharacterized protein n=1 Tax=Cyclospora cayetanensis TaxID=88456 RepID=A0A1D3CZT9_9EIME|nr:hypothetical protein cyc_07412 [Cyclospora cayetanensis]